MAVVEVKSLTKIFGKKVKSALKMVRENKSKNEILKATGATVGVYDVNFSVEPGEIFVIMGLSGSGKSTLIRLINRLIEPTAGSITVAGHDVSKADKETLRKMRRENMSMVFQSFGLLPNRTVLENTEYGLELRGVDPATRRQRAEEALDNLHLLEFKNQLPSQLSGGMQQRVGLARALANNPDILLMDEAFSALDPLIRKEMQDELLGLQEKLKKTIIFITHDLNEALHLGDRIAVMKDGQIQQIGTGEELLTNPANDYVKHFLSDVDSSRVLTAENIMEPAVTVNIDREGPNMALHRMREERISMVVAIDNQHKLQGVISADAARSARLNNLPLRKVLDVNMPTIDKETTVNDIFNVIYDAHTPVAVTDNGRLLGVVIRGRVIETLADEDAPSSETNDVQTQEVK